MTKTLALRSGLTLAAGASLFALASPAYADCALATTTVANDTVACAATVTTDTTASAFPTTSREVQFLSTNNQYVNVTGAITGYGLALTQTDTGAKLLTVNNTGSVTVNAGNTPTAGVGDGALRITSYGDNVTYLGSGTIANLGTGDGLQIEASGAATPVAVNINAGGAITTANGDGAWINAGSTGSTINATFTSITAAGAGVNGLQAVTTTGAQTLNSGVITSSGNGILAQSTSGAITANVTGNVTSTAGAGGQAVSLQSTAAGVQTVNVTGGNVTNTGGTAIQTSSTGAQGVTIGAGRTVSGATGIRSATSGGVLTVTNNGTLTGTTAAISSVAQANITNAATGTITGPLVLSAFNDTVTNNGTVSLTGASDFGAGTDTFTNNGTLNVTGGATVANLETFVNGSAGVVNLASGSTLTAAAATAFTNNGRFNAEAGPVTIVTPTFTNGATGSIDMQDGAIGDITTITGAYVGTAGSRLLIDANADLSGADRLVVSGNISGVTTLGVGYLGTAATFNPTGALVVDGGGTTAAGSFVLDPASVTNGLLTYGLDLRGADYYLTSNFNVGVTGLAPLARMGSDLWYQSFDAYHDGIAGRHGYKADDGTPVGFWANLYMSRDKWGDTAATTTLFNQPLAYSSEVENNRRGAQGGFDFGLAGFTVGVTAGYEKNKANNGTFADYNIEGYNYGAYALFGSQAGLYGGVMYKRDDFDVTYRDNSRGFGLDLQNAHSDGWDAELGFRAGSDDGIKFDLNGGLSWVKTKIDPVTLYGSTFSYDGAESMRGRLGARMIFPQAMGAFVGAKVFHEFKDDGEGLLITSGTTTGTLMPDPRGTTYRVEAGLGGDARGGPVVSIWGDFGDSKGIGGRVGFRF